MSRQSVLGPVPLTSLTKRERLQLQAFGQSFLGQVGGGVGDEWFETVTYQARKPATDDEIELSAWEPGTVVG